MRSIDLEGIKVDDGKTVSVNLTKIDNSDKSIDVFVGGFHGATYRLEISTAKNFSSSELIELKVSKEDNTSSPFKFLRIKNFELSEQLAYVLANGIQCWSYSPMLGEEDVLKTENNPKQMYFGDSRFYKYPEKPGQIHAHSFSYGMLRSAHDKDGNPFWGALDEDLCFTIFEFNLKDCTFSIALDVEGLDHSSMDKSKRPVDENFFTIGAWVVPDPFAKTFDPLFETTSSWMQALRERERVERKFDNISTNTMHRPLRGYTSWYYKYTNISEKWLTDNLNASPNDWKVFQVDDGYQTAVGDWLTFTRDFKDGLKPLFKKVRDKHMTPGIWFAPFVAHENSEVFKKKAHLLLKDKEGSLVECGDFDHWGGKFYAFDTENEEFKDHIRSILKEFKSWGAGFVKADFLYASAMIPHGGLTRAQRASKAHQFLWEACRDEDLALLSCGATLQSAYGRCEYSRIGADVLPSWEDPRLLQFTSREKCSTRSSIVNTVTRSILDGVAFLNDPDVIMLCEEDNFLSNSEKLLLAAVNNGFGSLIFNSDYVAKYKGWQKEVLQSLCPDFAADKSKSVANNIVCIHFEKDGANDVLLVKQFSRSWRIILKEGEPEIQLL